LRELDHIQAEAGLPDRGYTSFEQVICNVLDYYQIHTLVDAATRSRSGLSGGEWLHKAITDAGGTVSFGKADEIFQAMENKVMEMRGE
jgi:hypothetical protein